jgi:hypothetical protein
MSGLEVGAAVFGLIVGAIQIIETSIEIYGAVKDKSGIPPKLQKVSEKLPSIKDLLKSAEAQNKDGMVDKMSKLDRQMRNNAEQEVEHCKQLCQELQDVLASAFPKAEAGKAGRLWKGTMTVVSGKGKKAEQIFKEISQYLQLLADRQIITNTELLEDIKASVKELFPQDGTINMTNENGDNVNGTQNKQTGSGKMFTSAISGLTFNEGTKSVPE